MRLETNRLYLRTLAVEDASQQYVNWLNDHDVNQFLETRHSIQTIISCRKFVDETNKDKNSHLFGIFNKTNNQHIGNAKIGFINKQHGTGEISLFIGEKSSWGKGYGKETICCLTQYGFESLDLARIEAGCYEKNTASLQSFLSLGYSVEGFFRKKYVSQGNRCGGFWLGMLREEFKSEDLEH